MVKLTSRYLSQLCLIISILYSAMSMAGGTADKESIIAKMLVNKIEVACHRFLKDELTVNDLESLFSRSAEQDENKRFWLIRSDKYQVRVSIEAETKTSQLEQLAFYPDDINLVALEDLERLFGKEHEIARSEYTWVKFESQKLKSGDNVRITAQLFFLPESKVCPVDILTLRRENNAEHQ